MNLFLFSSERESSYKTRSVLLTLSEKDSKLLETDYTKTIRLIQCWEK